MRSRRLAQKAFRVIIATVVLLAYAAVLLMVRSPDASLLGR